MEKKTREMSRRQFLGYSALGLAGLTILPSWVMANGKRIAPSDRVVMGWIGLGQQGNSDFYAAAACPGVQVVAGCDVDSLKRERFKRRVEHGKRVKTWFSVVIYMSSIRICWNVLTLTRWG